MADMLMMSRDPQEEIVEGWLRDEIGRVHGEQAARSHGCPRRLLVRPRGAANL